ncbi:MAG: DUF4956 domain-containing protein [Candidatus Promineofilum sp.]|nr:DUF4956 domain-containing protein [Promineifilum sp.]
MSNELLYFVLGAGLNLLVALLVVRFVYYPATQDKTYVFTFLAFNTVIYFVLGLLTSANLSVGVGFGLFAIFSVLRYRTDEMPIREMTYLFILIALPVMNSVMISEAKVAMLFVANGAILGLLIALEREWGFRFAGSKRVMYDRVDLLGPANEERLLADLRERTGLAVARVDVKRIDFLHDAAELVIYYEEPRAKTTKRQLPHPAPKS